MKNIVILISGRGSNMEAIVRACQAEGWPGRIAAVISNRPDAAGLKFAASHGIATAVVDHKGFADRAPAEVVEETRAQLAGMKERMKLLEEARALAEELE